MSNVILYKKGRIVFSSNILRRWGNADIRSMEDNLTKKGLILPLSMLAVDMQRYLEDGVFIPDTTAASCHIGLLLEPTGDLVEIEFTTPDKADDPVRVFRKLRGCTPDGFWVMSPSDKVSQCGIVAVEIAESPTEALRLINLATPIVTVGYHDWKLPDLVEWVKQQMAKKYPAAQEVSNDKKKQTKNSDNAKP